MFWKRKEKDVDIKDEIFQAIYQQGMKNFEDRREMEIYAFAFGMGVTACLNAGYVLKDVNPQEMEFTPDFISIVENNRNRQNCLTN